MGTIVDALGVPCPQPVIRTRDALRAGVAVTTIVDNETSQHNVTRVAGEISNMYAIAETLLNAGKVVSL
jgi:TusA-related sulfurtransferase